MFCGRHHSHHTHHFAVLAWNILQHPAQMQSLEDKLACEKYLASEGLNWTSIRPVYIYGSLDFNFCEKDAEDNDFLTFQL